jgi:predicted secreted Zn-dependent protease
MNELSNDARLTWRRSTKCDSGLCVEVAATTDAALVRDGKRPEGSHLTFVRDSWQDFIAAVKTGEYDRQ